MGHGCETTNTNSVWLKERKDAREIESHINHEPIDYMK
jgi:hypothetical protein